MAESYAEQAWQSVKDVAPERQEAFARAYVELLADAPRSALEDEADSTAIPIGKMRVVWAISRADPDMAFLEVVRLVRDSESESFPRQREHGL